MGDWGNLRLRQQSIDNIAEFLKTEKGKKLGYSNASQLAEYVLRNFMENPDQNQRIEELEESYQKLRKQYVEKRSENSAIKEEIAIKKLIEKSEDKKNKEIDSLKQEFEDFKKAVYEKIELAEKNPERIRVGFKDSQSTKKKKISKKSKKS